MKTGVAAFLASFLAAAPSALAGASFACIDPDKPDFPAACEDKELSALDRAIGVGLGRLQAATDSLTRVLLRRDQRWFAEVLAAKYVSKFEGADDPLRQRIDAMLQSRLTTVRQIQSRLGTTDPAGTWANALATLRVARQSDDSLRVEMAATVTYGDRDEPFTCGLSAVLVRGNDHWYAGKSEKNRDDTEDDTASAASAEAKEPADKKPAMLRLRMQANTLRVVLTGGDTLQACNGPDLLTGSYFATTAIARPSASTSLATRTVLPSFDCAKATNIDEEEICADPDLAHADQEIARVYRETARRVGAALANHLRQDQRAWARGNALTFEAFLHPGWDKPASFVHQTGSARAELERRQNERLAMLTNLDETRKGFAGLWVAHNAMVSIVPAANSVNGTLKAEGEKWETGYYKARCDLGGEGRIERAKLKIRGEAPEFVRDGATLTVDGTDPGPDRNGDINRELPGYCTRLHSAKARLFPVRPDPRLDLRADRFR